MLGEQGRKSVVVTNFEEWTRYIVRGTFCSSCMTEPTKSSVWDYKPWWCQPWSILLTGISAIAGSWWLFHRYWLTGIVAVPILAWMGFFLLLFPRLVAEAGLLDDTSDIVPPDNLPKV